MERSAEMTRTVVGLTLCFYERTKVENTDDTDDPKYETRTSPPPPQVWFLGRSDRSHQEQSLNLGHSSSQHSAHVVTDSSQQDAEHGDAHQGVAHAEQLAVPRPRRQVPKTW